MEVLNTFANFLPPAPGKRGFAAAWAVQWGGEAGQGTQQGPVGAVLPPIPLPAPCAGLWSYFQALSYI